MLSWDRIRQLPCGCRYDAPSGVKTYECNFCRRKRQQLERKLLKNSAKIAKEVKA